MDEGRLQIDLSTAEVDGKRKYVFPIPARGKWQKRRLVLGWALMAWLLAAPWLKINGQQAIFFDLAQRKIHFLGTTFWVNEMVIFMLFTLSLLMGIVFLTVILGRVFCGWACPITVFMEFVFRPIERWIEGAGPGQRLWKRKPLSDRWIALSLKWTLFAIVAFVLGNTFVAYVVGSHRLIEMMLNGPTENWGPFIFMLISFGIILFQFGWFREQVCLFVCPYGRLQSVLLDKDSLIVAYDKNRGEPRGKKGSAKGDCIDCKLCVNVCPTGIDIRNGLQLECIHCTQCVDACDSIMKKIDRPLGLIRYQTEAEVERQSKRFWRPRLAIYSGLLLAIVSLLTGFAAHRKDFNITLHRETSREMFTVAADGKILTPVRVHITSRSERELLIRFEPLNPPSLEIDFPEGPLHLSALEKATVHLLLKLPREEFHENFGLKDIRFRAITADGIESDLEMRVVGPAR